MSIALTLFSYDTSRVRDVAVLGVPLPRFCRGVFAIFGAFTMPRFGRSDLFGIFRTVPTRIVDPGASKLGVGLVAGVHCGAALYLMLCVLRALVASRRSLLAIQFCPTMFGAMFLAAIAR